MTISHTIESVNIVIGILSNSALMFLSLRFSKHNLGTYKYLIMIFAGYDLFLTVIHAITDTKIHNFGTVFGLFSARFPDNSWMAPIYVSCFSVPFALTNINFLHRYWAVKKPTNLQLFSRPQFALFLAMYPIGQCSLWSWLAFQSDLDDDNFVRDYYYERYNVTVTGWRVMHHWKDGKLNVPQFLILLSATVVMSINFAIATFLATQTISEISKAKTFSSNYKTLQIKILRALFAQTAVPVLFVYVPFGCAILFPFFNINDTFHIANLCMTMTSFFPAWDAIVVILLIKNYRDGLLSLLWPDKAASSTATTVWKSQITTTSFRLE